MQPFEVEVFKKGLFWGKKDYFEKKRTILKKKDYFEKKKDYFEKKRTILRKKGLF